MKLPAFMAGRRHDERKETEEEEEENKENMNERVEKMLEAGEITYTAEELEDVKCGLGSCKPHWIQWLATKEVYMVVYVLVGLTQGMFFTYSVSVISTIEKRFKFTSKQTGILLSGNDISQVMLAMFLGYYGTFGNRPRWMGVGILFTAASCFTAGLPHFIYGPGQDAIDLADVTSVAASSAASNHSILAPPKKEELCRQPDDVQCQTQGSEFLGAVLLMFLSQFFVGIAISIYYSLGVTYLDDNINKKTYPLYITLVSLLRVVGPVVGFVIGGRCLAIWIDPSRKPNLSNKDPRWLGAWWLGFMFLGGILTFVGFLLFFFPKKLPATLRRETKQLLKQVDREAAAGGTRDYQYFATQAREKRTEAKPTLKNLLKALKRLFTNKVWVGNLFNTVLAVLAISGYWTFKPKYVENQFRKSATEANYYTGFSSLVVSVFGAAVSGSVLRWWRPGPRLVTGYNIFITAAASLGCILLMFVGCPKLEFVGPVGGVLPPSCSSECGCSDKFTPVCGQDQATVFYSPCYAGCSAANITADPIVYNNCSCIIGGEPLTSPLLPLPDAPLQEGGFATRGYCPEPCNGFFYYMLVQIIVQIIGATGRLGGSILHLRCVADEDKGIALGTMTVFLSFFAFIPAPIIMGAIIDSACLVWDSSCGVTGNCWLYDSDKFRTILHLVPAILLITSGLGDIVVFRNSHSLDLYGLKQDAEVELGKVADKSGEEGHADKNGEEGRPLKGDAS